MGVLYCYYHLFSQNFTGQHNTINKTGEVVEFSGQTLEKIYNQLITIIRKDKRKKTYYFSASGKSEQS